MTRGGFINGAGGGCRRGKRWMGTKEGSEVLRQEVYMRRGARGRLHKCHRQRGEMRQRMGGGGCDGGAGGGTNTDSEEGELMLWALPQHCDV